MISFDMTMREYLAHSAIGSSTLKNIMSTPADYKAALEQRNQDTPATILGTAIHCLLLEPHLFESTYALQPENWGSRANGTPGGKKWKEFKTFHQGKICMDFEDAELLQRISKAAKNHPALDRILQQAKFEVTAITEVNGIQLKAKTDILCPGHTWDVKMTRDSLDDESMFKTVFGNGYHFQGAHHTFCFNQHEEYKDVQSYGWIFISNSTPAAHIRVVRAPKTLIEWSRRDHSYALSKLKQCMETNTWEGYSNAVSELTIPEWARKMYE